MNNNFITGILTFLIIGLLGCIIAFGIDAYKNMDLSKYEEAVAKEVDEQLSKIEKKEDISTPQIVETPIGTIDELVSAEEINYQSSASRTRYFYNQLDNYSKIIYDGIEANIDEMKSGTYKVQFGNKFSNILSKEDGQTELGNYYQSAIEAFTYDNPSVFFLDPTKMYLNIQTTTKGNRKTYNVYITSGDKENYLAKGFKSEEQINQYIAQIEQIKKAVVSNLPEGNIEKKIRYIHDYLVDNLSYDQTLSQDNIYNLYGALINKECVCEGYAKAFKYLLDEAGIDNVIVVGIGTNSQGQTENHAWNYVAIDGNWYAVDVTWDDPIMQGIGGGVPTSYKRKYYLKGATTTQADHVPNVQFTDGGKLFTYPELSNSDY